MELNCCTMRKFYIILLSVFLFFSAPAYAQKQIPFQQGKVLVDAGLSLGVFGYGTGARHLAGFPVPLTASLEYGLSNMVGIGPYAGYLHQRVEMPGYTSSFTTMALGGQLVLHLSGLLKENTDLAIEEEKVDLYVKVLGGYERYGERVNGQRIERQYLAESGKPVVGAVAGARYMFNPSVGAFAEAGAGIFGWVNLGVSLIF